MEKSAKHIGKKKFAGLSSRQRHKLLAALAREAMTDPDYPAFQARYLEMLAWTPLDAFDPPHWLTEAEALAQYEAFHLRRAGIAPPIPDNQPNNKPWRPRFEIEVVADHIRTPYNLGSILRVIDNFGLMGLVVTGSHFPIDHPQLRRAAMGCEAWIPIRLENDLPAYLARDPRPAFALELDDQAQTLPLWRPPERCLLVLGNEEHGITRNVREACSGAVSIPMFGFKGSMNVTHAFAAAAYHMTAYLSQATPIDENADTIR